MLLQVCDGESLGIAHPSSIDGPLNEALGLGEKIVVGHVQGVLFVLCHGTGFLCLLEAMLIPG